MPWQVSGSFLRVNPDFSGATVWTQDQQATIKVIATRHDFHDEDLADGIAACLNLDGYNTMRAAIKMGNFKITGLQNGTDAADAITKFQLDQLQTQVDQNTTDIGSIGTQGDLITGQSFDGENLTSVRSNGNFVTDLSTSTNKTILTLRVGDPSNSGLIRQKLNDVGTGSGTTNIDVSLAGRHHVNNNGAFQLDLTGLPTADAVLGDNFQQEGSIVVDNLAAPGTIALGTAGEVIGTQSINNNIRQILTYFIQRIGGTNNVTYIWSVSG